jgi:hypothetical protein
MSSPSLGVQPIRYYDVSKLIADVTSSSNRSGYRASVPGYDHINRSVQFQNHPKTWLAGPWWAKPRPVPVNPRVLSCLARLVSSDIRFCVSGFLFIVAYWYLTVDRKILTLIRDCSFQMNRLPLYLKIIQTRSLSHLENECQWSVDDFCYWILVIYKATAYKYPKMR